MTGLGYSKAIGRTLAIGLAAALGALALASPVAAQEEGAAAAPPALRGAWAPLNRCPVDDPAMLAATGNPVSASCAASESPSGEIKLAGTTVTTKGTNLQFGLLTNRNVVTVVSPGGGSIIAEPVQIPGGLLGLMCPSGIPVVSAICAQLIDNNPINVVTAAVVAAGEPTEFSIAAGLGAGQPIVRLPVKIKLGNPFLGSNCFIGSNSDPIVLRPANQTKPTGSVVRFNADGTPNPTGQMGYSVTSNVSQADTTFAVPGANGCGPLGLLNFAVNLKQRLPSPSGQNSLVLNNTTTRFGGILQPAAFAPNQGQRLSEFWHAAAVS